MQDLRAVSYGHAVSSLGYEVKLVKEELTYRDAEHSVTYPCERPKQGPLRIFAARAVVKKTKHESEKDAVLDERAAQMIPKMILRALKVLKINAVFA